MYYQCSENKGADQLWSYCTADLHLCFRICKSRLSHDAAQLSSKATITNLRSAVLSYRLISIICFRWSSASKSEISSLKLAMHVCV